MGNFKVKITDSFAYEIEIKAKNKNEAIKKAKEYYENVDDGYVGVADANSFESTKIQILKDE